MPGMDQFFQNASAFHNSMNAMFNPNPDFAGNNSNAHLSSNFNNTNNPAHEPFQSSNNFNSSFNSSNADVVNKSNASKFEKVQLKFSNDTFYPNGKKKYDSFHNDFFF